MRVTQIEEIIGHNKQVRGKMSTFYTRLWSTDTRRMLPNPAPGKFHHLVHLNDTAQLLQGSHNLVCILFRHTLLHQFWRALNELLAVY